MYPSWIVSKEVHIIMTRVGWLGVVSFPLAIPVRLPPRNRLWESSYDVFFVSTGRTLSPRCGLSVGEYLYVDF